MCRGKYRFTSEIRNKVDAELLTIFNKQSCIKNSHVFFDNIYSAVETKIETNTFNYPENHPDKSDKNKLLVYSKNFGYQKVVFIIFLPIKHSNF